MINFLHNAPVPSIYIDIGLTFSTLVHVLEMSFKGKCYVILI